MFKQTLKKPDGRNLYLYSLRPIPEDIVPVNPPHDDNVPNPHMRWHPLRKEWVIYAAHRQNRTFLPPKDFSPLNITVDKNFPTEMPKGDYEVAVFENLFPSMTPLAHDPHKSSVETKPSNGQCEVVVFTQDPGSSLGELPLERITLILKVLGERTKELAKHPDVHYVMPFENRGQEMGVTLHHPHGQLYAYPFVPPVAQTMLTSMKEHFDKTGNGLLLEMIHAELKSERMITSNECSAAFIPVCARYPYETWIAPRRPVSYFHELNDHELKELAQTLKTTLQKFDALWDKTFPYLMIFYQAPVKGHHPYAHAHIQIYPPYRTKDKLKYLAGTEIGGGVFVNDSLPEEKARELREVHVQDKSKFVERAHGRVNLIGEHTDYNGGWVLPTAIPQFTQVTLVKREDKKVVIKSSQDRSFEYELGQEKAQSHWMDYLMGATKLMAEKFPKTLSGFEATIESNVPEGSGLSSSAALEMSFLKAMRAAWKLEITDVELALMGQRIENEFVGARVGIMDQMATSLCKSHVALFLDTQTLNFEQIKIPEEVELLVINSGISHKLSAKGGYNERRAQCEEVCQKLGIKSLREATMPMLEKAQLPPLLLKRGRHVITENERVKKAVEALKANDLKTLGKLFIESHLSMRDDYEVSIPEIDLLVELCIGKEEVFGARLTGGGFGGSIVALTRKGAAKKIGQEVLVEYEKRSRQKGIAYS